MLKEMFSHGAVFNPYVSYAVIQINRGESKTTSVAMPHSETELNCLPDSLLTWLATRREFQNEKSS